MNTRTSESIVIFRHPFSIGEAISDKPAGSYRVVKEEELIEGLSYPAYHAISTAMEIPSIGTPSMTKQFIQVSTNDLNAALASDATLSSIINIAEYGPNSMAERARNFDPTRPKAES